MKKFYFVILAAMATALSALVSCSNYDHADNLVINELMASNRTGLLMNGKKAADWVELKNNSKDSINLDGFELSITKTRIDSTSNKQKEEVEKWEFPDVTIGAGKCLVVFCDKKNKDKDEDSKEKKEKKDKKNSIKDLRADFNLPKEGGVVKLLAPNGKVLSEVKYEELEPDQSLALVSDSTYAPTFWHSPGFENTRDGYESASKKIDSQRKDPIRIWELMSRAGHSYENWVELKNVGSQPVDLSAYTLSKKGDKNEGWKFPARTLAPGEIISVQLAGGKANQANGLQANFKLGDKETVVLSKNGKFVDGLCAKLTPYGGSIGRQNGSQGFFFFRTPTRNAENGNGGFRYIAEKPEWDKKAGIYKGASKVSLRLKDPSLKVHYTLDGSEPSMDSPVIKDSLVLTKPTVVRSFAEGDSNTMRSNTATNTYLVGVNHDIPVISLSLNQDDFYGYNNGIYANGPGYGGDFPYSNANFWKDWTKRAHVELFDGKEGFTSDCGLKIFGGFSRALEKKSLRIKFRGEFGDAKVNYDFFNTGKPMEFADLVLRSGSQDYTRYMIKDEFFTSLAQKGSPTILTQMYRPVAVYVNGEYFGLYYLREKVNADFVARKLNLPNDSIDVFLSGPSPFREMVERISNLDMTKKENFEYARKNIDFQSLIDYKIGLIFAGRTDAGNVRYVRSRHPKSDKKWRFVFYDIDASWAPNGKPGVEFFLSTSPEAVKEEHIRHNVLINRLLRNQEFRQLFLQRLGYHLANTYSTKTTTAHFDKFIAGIRNEMKNNCKRWPQLSYDEWEKNITLFRKRLENRPQIILNDVRSYLSVTDAENKKYFSNLGY